MPKQSPVSYIANTEVKIYHGYSNVSRKKNKKQTELYHFKILRSSGGGKSINLRQTVIRDYFVISITTTKRMIVKGQQIPVKEGKMK